MTVQQFINRHLFENPNVIDYNYLPNHQLVVSWRARATAPNDLFWEESLTLPAGSAVVVRRDARVFAWRVALDQLWLARNAAGDYELARAWVARFKGRWPK